MASEGRVALVTGASRGIGRAILKALIGQGMTVVGTATSESGAQSITSEINALSGQGQGFVMNVCDSDSVTMTLKSVKEAFGDPLILVNNAGITQDNLMLRMKESEWLSVIDTNLNALYRVTKGCLRGMTKAKWGRIINIGSVVAASGNAGQVNYCAAKAGLEGFTRALAREVGSRAVTVNAVAPGYIETDMTKQLPDAQREAMLAQIPLARMGQPDDIASVVAFLAADESVYVTGATIPVNGGMYMG